MNVDRKRRLLRRLYFMQNGLCHYCGKQMILVVPKHHFQRTLPTQATLEHLHDRLNEERGKHRNEQCIVAACYECNHRIGKLRYKTICSKEEQWKRSGRYPQGHPLAQTKNET
jgi:hypothetical protein